jgi:hypothetical protein
MLAKASGGKERGEEREEEKERKYQAPPFSLLRGSERNKSGRI